MNTIALPPDDESDRRWGQWQSDYAASRRSTSQLARVAFGVIVTACIGWLGLQFVP